MGNRGCIQHRKRRSLLLIELIAISIRGDMNKEDVAHHVLIPGLVAPEVELCSCSGAVLQGRDTIVLLRPP